MVNPQTARRLKIAASIGLLLYCAVVLFNVITKNKQWDYKTYYFAAKTYFSGGDPYQIEALSRTAGEHITFPFVYPPPALFFFRPFPLFDYRASYLIFLGAKLIALAALIFIWRKFFLGDRSYEIVLFLLCALAYRETVVRDLYAGNVSCFEQLLVWSAAACFVKKNTAPFCFLIVISAFFKITSILFLFLPLIDKDRRSIATVISALAVFVSINLLFYANEPALFGGFLENLISPDNHGSLSISLEERGNANPASFALIKDIVEVFSQVTSFSIPLLDLALYGIFVVLVLISAYIKAKTVDFRANRIEFIILCFFLYALTLPRFKDYSYMLLIVPTLHVIRNGLSSSTARVAAMMAVCITFLRYQPLLTAMTLFIFYLKYLRICKASVE